MLAILLDMPIWFQSIIMLGIVWIVARFVKRHTKILQRYFIPSSIVGGAMLLLLGPQVIEIIPSEMTGWLSILPALLINVVFAGLFIGKQIPKPKQIWQQAGPMIAFGNSIAWGMYVVAILLVLLLLGPVFGALPGFGALLEVSFSGGHGTAAGLAPVFEEMGQTGVRTMSLALATYSIVMAIVLGVAIINIYNRRVGRIIDKASMKVQQRRMIRNGYSLTHLTRKLEYKPFKSLVVFCLFGLAILLGWLMLTGLVWAEDILLAGQTDIRVFGNLPLFPVVMFGGLIIQIVLGGTKLERYIDLQIVQTISSVALDLLIITAIGTMSLSVIASNFESFAIIAVAGTAWVLFALVVLAPRFYRNHWFEYAMTDFGQAMGTTATGLLMNRLVDPLNRTGAREAFAYKQLAYEPFMGGGIVTAFAVVAIVEFGLVPVLIVSSVCLAFWIVAGLIFGSKGKKRLVKQLRVGRVAAKS